MASLRINIDRTALHRMLDGPTGPVAYNMRLRGKRAATRARQLAPGHMKYRIKYSLESGHVRLELNHPAALFVLLGTKRHLIRRGKAPGKMLKFEMGGRTVYARWVNHPGNKANNFLAKAMREAG